MRALRPFPRPATDAACAGIDASRSFGDGRSVGSCWDFGFRLRYVLGFRLRYIQTDVVVVSCCSDVTGFESRWCLVVIVVV